MSVLIRELPLTKHIDLDNTFVRDVLAPLPLRVALERPLEDPHAGTGTVDLTLYFEDGNVFARGMLQGWFEVACCRCVSAVRVSMQESMEVTFVPKGSLIPEADDGEEQENADVYTYTGEELDLTTSIREQILLSVPYAPLCKEECLGLCMHCGANLNEESCSCDRAVVDPRLAALKDMKV